MAQHARPIGPSANDAAAFTPSMVTGSGPDRPFRFSTRQHFGTQTLSQPTHVPAPFSPEMAVGHKPLFDVRSAPFTVGGSFSPPDVLSFGIETIYGSRPSSPRIFLAPRIPLPVSQTTHIPAPIGQEMTAGWKPAFDVRSAPYSQGSAIAPPDVLVFSIEMIVGARPDRPRLFSTRTVTGQQALSQTTPVAAPFSVEMATGWKPAASVRSAPRTSGGIILAPEVLAFSVEMVQEWRPSRGLRFTTRQVTSAQTLSQPTFTAAAFSPEMARGWQPERSRVFLGPRIALPLWQLFVPVPVNQAPVVAAGADAAVTLPAIATLSGLVTDDGLPAAILTSLWTAVSGPGAVVFGDATSASTTATFTTAGVYVLRLTASDSLLSAFDEVTITVHAAIVVACDGIITQLSAATADSVGTQDGLSTGDGSVAQGVSVTGDGTVIQ